MEQSIRALRQNGDAMLRLAEWLSRGDNGLSSRALATAALGRPVTDHCKYGEWNYPRDPADFGRCARLLRAVPEVRGPGFARLSSVEDPHWEALIPRWDEIHTMMEREVGIDWSKGKSAPLTYDFMRDILNSANNVPHFVL